VAGGSRVLPASELNLSWQCSRAAPTAFFAGLGADGVALLLSLLAALGYGASDFAAGVGSRRASAATVALVAQSCSVIATLIAVQVHPGGGATPAVLGWGTLSGVGTAVGSLCLYRGLAIGSMSVVATCSALLTAALPAGFGLLLGEHLGAMAETGVACAVAAIFLVSWRPGPRGQANGSRGILYGMAAGLGFAIFFIALDRAGTGSGAWPLLPGQVVAVLIEAPFAARAIRGTRPATSTMVLPVVAGVLGGLANIMFLSATGQGRLAVVAVLTSLYPGVTILLARTFLGERWSRLQSVGLLGALLAIGLISAG